MEDVMFGQMPLRKCFPPAHGDPPFDSNNPYLRADLIPLTAGTSNTNPIYFVESKDQFKRVMTVIMKLARRGGESSAADELESAVQLL